MFIIKQIIVIAIFFVPLVLFSQNLDSMIRFRHPELHLSNNFYVVTYPLAGASTTFAPQAIKAMRDLTINPIRKCDEDIIFVFMNKAAISKSKLLEYMKSTFLWGDWQFKQVKYIVDDDLYNALNQKGELVKQLYFNNGYLKYNKVVKTNSINEKYIKHSKFKVIENKAIAINDTTTILLTRDNIYPFDQNHLLILSDNENKIMKVNINNGEVSGSFSLQKLNRTDFFCQHIAKGDTLRCNYAKRFEQRLISSNRKCLYIMNVVKDTVGLYCFVSVEAFQPSESNYHFNNDEGNKKTIAKDMPILIPYNLMIKLNDDFAVEKYYQVGEVPKEIRKRKEIFNTFDVGFSINKGQLFVQNTIYPLKLKKTPAISIYSIRGDSINWESFSNTKSNRKEQKKNTIYNLKTFYYHFAGRDLFSYDYFGNIYDVTENMIVGSLEGDGTPKYKRESYAMYVEKTVKTTKLNYHIHTVAPINNGKYLAIVYVYKDKIPLLEIKDTSFKTIDVVRLSNIESLKNYFDTKIANNILIENNQLFILSTDNKKYYINSYNILPSCE